MPFSHSLLLHSSSPFPISPSSHPFHICAGGFSDRPGDMVDPFHTLFGVAALALLGDARVEQVNSVFCLPQRVVDRVFDGYAGSEGAVTVPGS